MADRRYSLLQEFGRCSGQLNMIQVADERYTISLIGPQNQLLRPSPRSGLVLCQGTTFPVTGVWE